MATYMNFKDCAPCEDHGNDLPAGEWLRGSEMMTCLGCDQRFAGWECACELVHDCAVA